MLKKPFQFDDLLDALYDTPWYEMEPNKRKQLLMVMIYLQRTVCIKSGGIQPCTYEWFVSMMKGAYSTSLILESQL